MLQQISIINNCWLSIITIILFINERNFSLKTFFYKIHKIQKAVC